MRRIVLGCVLLLSIGGRVQAQPFSFVALGDTAYNGERDYSVYRALIKSINAVKPAFTIHVGDIWGAGSCDDAHMQRIAGYFALYEGPLVYTPGDNEWTDCDSRLLGGFDAQERLRRLRTLFFKDARSLGQAPMSLVRQGDVAPGHKAHVENARWHKNGVLFVTANIPGSNNGFDFRNAQKLSAAHDRVQAVTAWIRDSFRIAREQSFKAVVFAYHAEMFDPPEGVARGPYSSLIEEIRLASERFARPVLLVHGDAHKFIIDRPLQVLRGEGVPSLLDNVTRLQVYGAPEIKAVQVDVNPESRAVFAFKPLY